MKKSDERIKSVAIIGAGAAGAVTAAAFKSENYYHNIRIFERRDTAGGTWNYDPSPPRSLPLRPGHLPSSTDPPLLIPENLPTTTSHVQQERFIKTPVYASLTTNVPAIAMSFSDIPFAYGPFVPHHVPRQYIENYISHHRLDSYLSLNTTVEDVSKLSGLRPGIEKWKLTLRRHDLVLDIDVWWEEMFDAVILANGHYSVPFLPQVKGLEEYINLFPGKISHSKTYRAPELYRNKRILIIGSSASAHDLTKDILLTSHHPIYQSRRSPSRWDGDSPPAGIVWKPIISEYLPSGRISFSDDTYLNRDDVDFVIYCTGYLPSFPFWNEKNNGRALWSYQKNRLLKAYAHTFFQDFKSLAIVGLPRVLTFRSFEYQAIALARLWSGRQAADLPPVEDMRKWEEDREKYVRDRRKKFHDIEWESGETLGWLGGLYNIAGLPLLTGEGRAPPLLGEEVRWAIENVKKYPDHEEGENTMKNLVECLDVKELASRNEGWVIVERHREKDLLAFI